MRAILLLVALSLSTVSIAQIYNNPGGYVSTCGGTFYDSGGSAGNYGNNENITTTFCSNAGTCVRVNFTQLNLQNGDVLTIFDGNSTGGTVLGTFTNTATAPGIFTSSSGCLTFRFVSNGSGVNLGWTAAVSCVACPTITYTHPTTGINGEFVGSCLVSNCGPSTYTDNGGALGNYSSNIPMIYRVFCPSQAGNCMRVTFNSLALEAPFFSTAYDMLFVQNGPTQNSPVFTGAPNAAYNLSGWGAQTGLTGALATPFSFTSTDPSGCLTFRFASDGSVTAPGWSATLQCVPCASGPSGTDNSDCKNFTALCSGVAVPGNSVGPGIMAEGCTGSACPAGGENHTNWYKIQISSTGTLDITLTPSTATDDYDFAIFGPNAACNNLGAPIRCTDSGVQGVTGTNGTAGDFTEDVTGDSFLQTLNVVAGQTYLIAVDEWSPNAGSGYTMTFGGTAGLDCVVLPVELSEFNAEYVPDHDVVDITWATESERDNDYFVVEKSLDGNTFHELAKVNGVGNSTMETKYYAVDNNPQVGVNYYRLKQVDVNGEFNYSPLKSVNLLDDAYDIISVSPNPTNNETTISFNCYNKEEATLKLYDSKGNLFETAIIDCTPGGNQVKIDLSSKPDGVYFVTITTNNKAYNTKLLKQ